MKKGGERKNNGGKKTASTIEDREMGGTKR